MFIPLGYDRSEIGVGYVTVAIIALNVVIWIASVSAESGVEARLMATAVALEQVEADYPDAALEPGAFEQLQPLARLQVGHLPTRDGELVEGDVDLTTAAQDFSAALAALPAVRYGYTPAEPTLWQAVSSLFMHADFFHLFGNMLFLWILGFVVEYFWDRWAFVATYLLGGLAAVAAHHLASMGSPSPLVGASGAISCLMGAFVVGHPETRIKIGYLFVFGFRPVFGSVGIPAWVCIPAWVGMDIIYLVTGSGGPVAYWAHIGGFIFGAAATFVAAHFGWRLTEGELTRVKRGQVLVRR
jgi:membrane associated rhomboid family serine protease